MKTFLCKDLPVGVLLILVAFWAGSNKSALWGMLGFLPFFMIGLMVILRGWDVHVRKIKDDSSGD